MTAYEASRSGEMERIDALLNGVLRPEGIREEGTSADATEVFRRVSQAAYQWSARGLPDVADQLDYAAVWFSRAAQIDGVQYGDYQALILFAGRRFLDQAAAIRCAINNPNMPRLRVVKTVDMHRILGP